MPVPTLCIDIVAPALCYVRPLVTGRGRETVTPFFRTILVFLPAASLSTVLAGGGTIWNELGDAGNFPAGLAQQTRGSGRLDGITGNLATGDGQDSFCIRITDPARFEATTDTDLNGFAIANFDSQLYLFDDGGTPVLANDDTPGGSNTQSNLTGTATDGSGFTLTRGGDYVLVISAFPDRPLDTVANPVFPTPNRLIHRPNAAAGRFSQYSNNPQTSGSYFITLQGAAPCQERLELVLKRQDNGQAVCWNHLNSAPFCTQVNDVQFLESVFGFVDTDAIPDAILAGFQTGLGLCTGRSDLAGCSTGLFSTEGQIFFHAAKGDLNGDGFVDVVLDGLGDDLVCLGGPATAFTSCRTTDALDGSNPIQLAYIDGDANLDLVLVKVNEGLGVCPGDGLGGFGACSFTPVPGGRVKLGRIDGDNSIDALVGSDGPANSVCLGNGDGSFSCGALDGVSRRTFDAALADLNGDGALDAVLANVIGSVSAANRVCLGDGAGSFACEDLPGAANSISVAVGLIDNDDNPDLVFAEAEGLPGTICSGDGSGLFICEPLAGLPDESTFDVQLVELGDDPRLFTNGFE